MTQLNKLYEQGSPAISDAEYDGIFGADQTLDKAGDSSHLYRMGSIRKIYVGEDAVPNQFLTDCIETVKLDGLACRIVYSSGQLVSAATRGDGDSGTDITRKVRLIDNVPIVIDSSFNPVFQVRGEIVCLASVSNSRNVVAGAITHEQDIEKFKAKAEECAFAFIAYDVEGVPNLNTFKDTLDWLDANGFDTPLNADMSIYPNDGKVLRILDNNAYYASGFTGNYKNGIIAVKTRKASVTTHLLNVAWQVSPRGAVVPVAELETVEIDGARVSRATLNNAEYLSILIHDKGLRLGATVGVIRAGEIIPAIVHIEADGSADIEIPDSCPSCGTLLETKGVHLHCPNGDCPAQVARLTQHFFSTLGVKGLGLATAEKLGLSPVEIIKLTRTAVCAIMGDKLGNKLCDQIDQLKTSGVSSDLLLQAMSIPMLGKQGVKLLPPASEWTSDTNFRKLIPTKVALANSIQTWYDTTFQEVWGGEWPLSIKAEEVKVTPTSTISVCATGKIAGYTKKQLADKLSEFGVQLTDSVTKKTNYLICETVSSSASYNKAKELGIEILTLTSLLEKLP